MHVMEPRLAIPEAHISIAEADPCFPQGLDLRPKKDKACLHSTFYMIQMSGLTVLADDLYSFAIYFFQIEAPLPHKRSRDYNAGFTATHRTVSVYRVLQMRGGVYADVLPVLQVPDNKANAVPCERLRIIIHLFIFYLKSGITQQIIHASREFRTYAHIIFLREA